VSKAHAVPPLPIPVVDVRDVALLVSKLVWSHRNVCGAFSCYVLLCPRSCAARIICKARGLTLELSVIFRKVVFLCLRKQQQAVTSSRSLVLCIPALTGQFAKFQGGPFLHGFRILGECHEEVSRRDMAGYVHRQSQCHSRASERDPACKPLT
jgi:hypothetical protein